MFKEALFIAVVLLAILVIFAIVLVGPY